MHGIARISIVDRDLLGGFLKPAAPQVVDLVVAEAVEAVSNALDAFAEK